jgi:hypothetical protein
MPDSGVWVCAMGLRALPPRNPGGWRQRFLLEKKHQETFTTWRKSPASLDPNCKSFLLLFFKKEGLASAIDAAEPA